MLGLFSQAIIVPTPLRGPSSFEDLSRLEAQRRREILSLLMADSYAAEPRYKSGRRFWDIYDGLDEDFYK